LYLIGHPYLIKRETFKLISSKIKTIKSKKNTEKKIEKIEKIEKI
jgi:hypothetical protein